MLAGKLGIERAGTGAGGTVAERAATADQCLDARVVIRGRRQRESSRAATSGRIFSLSPAGTSEAAFAACAGGKFIDDVEGHLQHRHDHELRQAVERIEHEGFAAAVPGRHHDLALVVRSRSARRGCRARCRACGRARARQDQRRQAGVGEVDGDAVGISIVSPGWIFTGASMQARRSSPAERAWRNGGVSRRRGSRMRTSIRCMACSVTGYE